MSIPDFQTVMLPLLQLAADKIEHSVSQAMNTLSDRFHLSESELRQLLPSGKQVSEQLANYMIEYDIGVISANSYYIKKIDYDYFSE